MWLVIPRVYKYLLNLLLIFLWLSGDENVIRDTGMYTEHAKSKAATTVDTVRIYPTPTILDSSGN